MTRPLLACLVAITLAWGAAQAQPGRFVVVPAENGPEGSVRLDTYTGAVAVLSDGADGADGAMTWSRIGVPSGARVPSSYTSPSYVLSELPLRAERTFLVDGQGGRVYLLRRSGDQLLWQEVQ